MTEMFLTLGLVLYSETQCSLTDQAGAGWTASAALEERAEEQGMSEYRAGAVLILWREDACATLETQLDLLPQTTRALENECSQVIYLPAGTEAEYLEAARQPIRDGQPDLVSLAWASPPASGQPAFHIFLVADGAHSLRISSAGYGRPGAIRSECGHSPWALAAAVGR